MKTIRPFPFLLFMLSVGIAQAQFPQVAELDTAVFPIRSLGSGMKLIEEFIPGMVTRTIYNQDLSVFRVLHYSPPPSGMEWANMGYITEELFDTDPSTIEFTMVAYTPGSTGDFATFVYRDDGTQLFEQHPGGLVGGAGAFLTSFEPIYTYNGQTYMILFDHAVFGPPTRIYALPGTVPCMDCYGSPGENGIGLGGTNVADPVSRIMLYPNPSRNSATLELGRSKADMVTIWDAMGQLVRTQDVGSGTSITLSLSHLPAGFYTVSVERNGLRITALPLVVRGE
jgi:hypothetical protein